MISFIAWLPESGWSRLLCDALWQSTLIAAVGCLAARFLTRQSAARAWLLLLTLTACVFVPLASVAARESGWAMLGRGGGGSSSVSADRTGRLPAVAGQWHPATELQASDRAASSAAETGTAKVEPPHTAALAGSARNADTSLNPDAQSAIPEWAPTVLRVLGLLWVAASALLALRLALSCIATRRLVRQATPCNAPAFVAASATAAQRVGLSRSPVLLISHDVRTPTVFALGRPRLLIPADDASRATGNGIDWAAAFTHELAHAARRDGWARLWVEFILIALPIQPLIWLARRAFHTACEEACDDWAVATGSNPIDLAEMLTAWMHGSKPRPTLLAIGMSSTKARTLRLLALRGKPIARLGRAWQWAGIPAALLLVGGLASAQSPHEKKRDPSPTPAAASKGEIKAATDKPTGSSGKQTNAPPYVIEPPDILTISPVQLAPKETTRVAPLDKVRIEVSGDPNSSHMYQVDSSGEVVLGPGYGAVKISGLTRAEAEQAVKKKLEPVFKEPQVSLIIDETRRESGISGDHLVGPDGTINLGIYGGVKVAGLTVYEARAAVERKLGDSFVEPKIAVDVSKYSGKIYYLIVFNNVRRMTTTGNETVMDAVSEAQDSGVIPALGDESLSISIARPASASSKRETLDVRWQEVLQGDDTTNYQILPGDRIFVKLLSGPGGAVGGGRPAESGTPATSPSKP